MNLLALFSVNFLWQALWLDLSFNDIHDEGCSWIGNCISCIDELLLQSCGISFPGVKNLMTKFKETGHCVSYNQIVKLMFCAYIHS